MSEDATKETVPFFRKRGTARKNIRKRIEEPEESQGQTTGWKSVDGTDDTASAVKTKARTEIKAGANPFVQGTKKRKHGAQEEGEDDASYSRKPEFAYEASRNVARNTDNGATRYAEWDTETDRDARALLDKHHAEISVEDDGMYRGKSEYKSFINKRDNGASANSKMKAGPIRAPANIRAISVIDYQPDVCKDYKETGYCGYGDSCKFMHDRGDYKSGWQLEKEWEEKGHIGKVGNEYEIGNDDSDEEEELPFACLICRNAFRSPVKTKCGHYFCEKCALSHYGKTNKCFACHAPTGGVFNTAKDLILKIAERKKKEEEEKELENEGKKTDSNDAEEPDSD